jgi:hypothetical protein
MNRASNGTKTMKTIQATAAATLLALSAAACEHGLTDVNNNPNVPTDVPTALLIRPSITGSAAFLGVGMSWNHAGLWAQHVAQIQYTDEDQYVVRDGSVQAFWDSWYDGPLKDIQMMIEKARATNRPNEEAVGLILKSWNFGALTDLYGDAPYSEALQGEAGNFTPAYDTQQEIYNGLFADLRSAAEMIAPGGTGFGAADLIYAGDMARWQKFANSLRLRNAIHLTNVDAAKARQEFEAGMAGPGGVFTSNAEEARLVYLASSPNRNPFFENQVTRNDHRISKAMVDRLQATSDPRLPIYANPIQDDGVSYVGHQNGVAHGVALTSRSRVGDWFTSATSPVFFMRHAEVLFIRAEAAQRGWAAGGTARDLYEAAVTASMRQYGISDAAITTFLAQPSVNFDAAADKLELIATQKWVALYGQGHEAFTEWRRTGHPELVAGPDNLNNDRIPRRLPYPALEQSLNGASYTTAVSRQGDITINGRVWWDRD